jgi:hypothetical protein|tara:strand:+ start:6489 stop:8123 length:1635 start_codon:yes stop_codon:yes gene_type:complete
MGYPLLESTSVTIVLGPFVDDTDFKTAETGLTINATDVRISKNGGTFVAATSSSTVHGENGYYLCTLATGNVDTLGSLDINVNVAGALAVYDSFTVEVANQYNSKFTTNLQQTNVTQYLGTNITESTAGRIATNNSTFWDNNDSLTTKTVDNVGSSIIVGPVETFSTGRLVTTGTENGVHTNTHAANGLYWGTTDTGTGILSELQYNINGGVGNPMKNLEFFMRYQSGGNRQMNILLYNYNTAGFVIVRTITSTGTNYDPFIFTSLDADYTDSNGDVRVQFQTTTNQNNDLFSIDLGQAIYEADTGSVPSAQEIAVETEAYLAALHGRDIWNGLDLQHGDIVSVTNQTTFILDDGPNQDDVFVGGFLVARSATFPSNSSGTYITDWDQGTRQITIAEPLGFTVQANDGYRVVANPPVNLDAIRGSLITESSQGRVAGNVSQFFDNADSATAKTVDDVGTLANTTANKTVIQEAMNELTVDTLTFEDFLNIGLSVFSGKFTLNTATGNTIFHRQNGSDQTIEINTVTAGNITTRTLVGYTPPPAP